MECDRCDKVYWIKNTSLDPIVIFLLKCILSIWYQHVYTLEPTKENEWNKAFPNWHLCPKRNGMYLENLKTMTYGDEEKYKKGQNTILVEDALETLQQLAQFHRKRLAIPIIGITGTIGAGINSFCAAPGAAGAWKPLPLVAISRRS